MGLAAFGLVSGIIIHSFEASLMNLILLALYMPMVPDTGGNTGSQSATVVIRTLALRESYPKDVFKELKITILLAVIFGVLSSGKVLFLPQGSEIPAGFSLAKIAAPSPLACLVFTHT